MWEVKKLMTSKIHVGCLTFHISSKISMLDALLSIFPPKFQCWMPYFPYFPQNFNVGLLAFHANHIFYWRVYFLVNQCWITSFLWFFSKIHIGSLDSIRTVFSTGECTPYLQHLFWKFTDSLKKNWWIKNSHVYRR